MAWLNGSALVPIIITPLSIEIVCLSVIRGHSTYRVYAVDQLYLKGSEILTT